MTQCVNEKEELQKGILFFWRKMAFYKKIKVGTAFAIYKDIKEKRKERYDGWFNYRNAWRIRESF